MREIPGLVWHTATAADCVDRCVHVCLWTIVLISWADSLFRRLEDRVGAAHQRNAGTSDYRTMSRNSVSCVATGARRKYRMALD